MQKDGRKLALDTRVLPWQVLTDQEKDILKDINGLLRQVHSRSSSEIAEINAIAVSSWANPRGDSRNNVIMLDGGRGTGKTSLLLTLLDGWNKPIDYKPIEKQVQFSGMSEIVKALPPIDFDPLPP